jgi:hypothetical protein
VSAGWIAIPFTADRLLVVMSQFCRQTSNSGSDKCGGIQSGRGQHSVGAGRGGLSERGFLFGCARNTTMAGVAKL